MTARAKRGARPWTLFEEGTLSMPIESIGFNKVWINNRYQVLERRMSAKDVADGLGLEGMVWLSIKRLDKLPVHDWRDLQRIKNELCGREREAVEVYPAESRMVDEANQYHLWVFPSGAQLPFGFTERRVSGPDEARLANSKQRAFE